MYLGHSFNDADFDRFDYLVPVLLLFLLAAAKWTWRYWHRESSRARRIVLGLLTIGAGCLLSWFALGRRPLWLLLVGLAIGPVAVLLRMQASWMNYQGPPETLQPLPRALEDLEATLGVEDEPPRVPPHKSDVDA
jgi:TRAP-type C4-dicarboxylate transport system permease small subunit